MNEAERPKYLVPRVYRLDDGDWKMTCVHPDGITTMFTGHSWSDTWEQVKHHVENSADHRTLRALRVRPREFQYEAPRERR